MTTPPESPPPSWEIIAPIWVYLLSFLAAIVSFLEAVREELRSGTVVTWKVRTFNLVAQVFSSGLAAILTHQILNASGVSEKWQLPLVGIGAHMGTEALKMLGDLWKRKVGITIDAGKRE